MERTYVFGDPSGNGGAANNLLASILPSLQNRGIDTGYLMGLLGNGNGNGGFFGNNGGFQDIIALIVIAAIFGNGNFGFGGNNNKGADEGREMIMQTLNRNGVDIASLAQAVNTSSDQILAGINSVSQAICGLGSQMGQNTNSILTAIMQGNNALTSQICSCCCDMKQLVTTQGYESQLAMCNQTNALINTANQNTLSLRDDYGRGFGMRGDEVEEAYKEGCRKGYEKAMREMRGEMGFRDGGRSYSGGGSSSGMDERRYPGYFPEYPRMDEMGERRRRRSNGEFY